MRAFLDARFADVAGFMRNVESWSVTRKLRHCLRGNVPSLSAHGPFADGADFIRDLEGVAHPRALAP